MWCKILRKCFRILQCLYCVHKRIVVLSNEFRSEKWLHLQMEYLLSVDFFFSKTKIPEFLYITDAQSAEGKWRNVKHLELVLVSNNQSL